MTATDKPEFKTHLGDLHPRLNQFRRFLQALLLLKSQRRATKIGFKLIEELGSAHTCNTAQLVYFNTLV